MRTFEIFLAFASHWLQPLYPSFPSLPPTILMFYESIISSFDSSLLHITRQTCIISRLYESLLSLFTDVLSKETWLQIFDFLFGFSEYPELFYLLIPAFIIILRTDFVNFATKENLPKSRIKENQDILDHIEESEKLLEDEQLDSLTKQIQFANNLQSHQLPEKFEFALAQFSDSFLSKLRLLTSSEIIKTLHVLLRKCYSNSLINFTFSSVQQPSTDLHYPIFAYTQLII
jgi:hypothetical protein